MNAGIGRGRDCYKSHRVSFEIHNGPVGDSCVCHACDNPSCVNPDHLFLDSHQGNMSDRDRKERQARGEKIHLAKANEEMVREIRAHDKNVSQYAIAKEYGLAPSTVWYIRNGKTWSHVS